MGKHKTEQVVIKTADVDKEIVPVVNWINSHSDAFTLYSCQGDPDEYSSKPHVLFVCACDHDLGDIIHVLNEYSSSMLGRCPTLEMDFHVYNVARYNLIFESIDLLNGFINYLKFKKLTPEE